MPYVASFGSGAIVATWEPSGTEVLTKGYQSAVTQAWFGSLSNMLGEFAPDVVKKLRKPKNERPPAKGSGAPSAPVPGADIIKPERYE
jgi:hypothetical protein